MVGRDNRDLTIEGTITIALLLHLLALAFPLSTNWRASRLSALAL